MSRVRPRRKVWDFAFHSLYLSSIPSLYIKCIFEISTIGLELRSAVRAVDSSGYFFISKPNLSFVYTPEKNDLHKDPGNEADKRSKLSRGPKASTICPSGICLIFPCGSISANPSSTALKI